MDAITNAHGDPAAAAVRSENLRKISFIGSDLGRAFSHVRHRTRRGKLWAERRSAAPRVERTLMQHLEGRSGQEHPVRIPAGSVTLEGDFCPPALIRGVVLFAHGSGSGR